MLPSNTLPLPWAASRVRLVAQIQVASVTMHDHTSQSEGNSLGSCRTRVKGKPWNSGRTSHIKKFRGWHVGNKKLTFWCLLQKNDSNFNLRVVGAIHTQSSWDIFSMAMWVIATSIYHRNRWFHKANHVPPCSVFSPASTVGDFATVCCSGSWGHYRAQHVAQSPWTSGIGGNILFFLIKVFEYRYLKLQTPKHYLQKSLGFRDREKHIEWNCFLIKVFTYRYLKL